MMDERVRTLLADRDSGDREVGYRALVDLFEMTDEPVEWAYEVWDHLLSDLTHRDGHKRAFAAQLLARLAISDPEGRMLEDFPRLAAVMKDEKTVTARHTLQSVWRVGVAGPEQKAMVLEALGRRFGECADEKNGTLVRTDVVTALGRLFTATEDEAIAACVDALIDSEADEKARRKQRTAWRRAIAYSGDGVIAVAHGSAALPHPLVLQLRFTRGEFRRSLRNVRSEDAIRRVGRLNSLGWSVGHLAWQEQKYFLHYGQGRMPFPEIDRAFRAGAPASTPELDEMWTAWKEITRQADPWLDTLDGRRLQQPYMRRDGKPGGRIVGSLVQRVIYHYWLHTGENMALRKLLGHAPLPQFVGNIDDQAPYVRESESS